MEELAGCIAEGEPEDRAQAFHAPPSPATMGSGVADTGVFSCWGRGPVWGAVGKCTVQGLYKSRVLQESSCVW